ncbi:hypothetical protein EMCRGX_G021378 [Ephydatia muelleri]
MRSIGSAATIAPKMIVAAKQSYLGDATVGIENNQRVEKTILYRGGCRILAAGNAGTLVLGSSYQLKLFPEGKSTVLLLVTNVASAMDEPVSVEVSTVTSATAVSEAVSTQAVAAKFGLHFDSRTGVLDPVALVGCRVSVSEKHDIIKLGPCQPSKHVLNHSQKSMQQHCSEQVFVHSDGVRRQWISYSVSKGALYCLPCLLFSDATLRGEHWRANQGNAFTTNGFCNWKKQYSAVLKHESSCAHRNAIVSQALFLQDDTVQQAFARADSVENARKRAIVAKNRTVLERIVKVLMLLGRQGLPIRGHREMMTDSMTNTGNFLETLKLLSTYDPPLQEHLEKIIERHQSASEGSSGQKGRGSVLTFMSYKSQNKLISIINEHITCTIVKAIHNCRAWSLMADTTPDISHHERRAPGTTAEDLYGVIMSVLKLRDVSFDKLIAQAYDGASNMSGCYNGLQSLIQTRINPNILYVHCYAHCLNLVISDAAATSVDVVTLFGNLETLYVLFTRSQKVHGLFEEVQRSQGCAIRSLKRLNTVRWSAREMCLSTFLERYECILLTLNQIQTEVSFDLKHRSEAAGLLSSIQTREFLATAFLFQEIFAKTGPLSRYLQSVNMDYAKALAMIDSVIASLERMRSAPQDIIDIMERSVQDSSSIQWKTTRVSRRMCRNTEDGEVLETSEESWQRKTFFVALDTIIASMRRRFDKNRSLFETLALFAPGNFTDLVKSGKSAQDLHCNVAEFCDKFQLNSNQCLQELLSFAAVYDRFHTPSSTSHRMDVEDITLTDLLSDETNDDGTTGVDQQTDPADQVLANWSFLDALNLLCNPAYHLYDAFPELVGVRGWGAPGQIEAGSGLDVEGSRTRPADILLPNWEFGKPAALDFTITSALNPSTLNEASVMAGFAASAAEVRKHVANDEKCSRLGWVCIPLSVETYGCWGEEAGRCLDRLATRIATRTGCPKSSAVSGLYGRLSIGLIRANARALLARSSSLS